MSASKTLSSRSISEIKSLHSDLTSQSSTVPLDVVLREKQQRPKPEGKLTVVNYEKTVMAL